MSRKACGFQASVILRQINSTGNCQLCLKPVEYNMSPGTIVSHCVNLCRLWKPLLFVLDQTLLPCKGWSFCAAFLLPFPAAEWITRCWQGTALTAPTIISIEGAPCTSSVGKSYSFRSSLSWVVDSYREDVGKKNPKYKHLKNCTLWFTHHVLWPSAWIH